LALGRESHVDLAIDDDVPELETLPFQRLDLGLG
jgi:hypothetical protein